jgi:hypothetical protein
MSELTPILDARPWPQSLIELLERQHTMVDRLVELAQAQSALIAESSTDRLLELLAKRQAVIDEFTQSQGDLSELTHGLDERLERVSADQRDHIKSVINLIGERLAQVMRRDEEDQAALRSNRQQVRNELTSMGAARQARSAYLGGPSESTRFSDRRG